MNESNDKQVQDDELEEFKEVNEGEDIVDWEAQAIENKGIAKRNQTKLVKKLKALEKDMEAKKAKAKVEKQESKKENKDFDYAQKAYLKASKIKSNEFELVEKIMKDTGLELEDVLESKYFKSELKEFRAESAASAAIPDGTKRSVKSTRDTADYWIARGELPPADQLELRREVVNKRLVQAESESKFTNRPVVGGK